MLQVGNETLMPIRNYKDLQAWQVAMRLTKAAYVVSSGWPKAEQYGLTSQFRRAAVSVPSNIAEGYLRDTDREKSRFLSITLGSLAEMETQYLLAKSFDYIVGEQIDFEALIAQTFQIVRGLKRSLKALDE